MIAAVVIRCDACQTERTVPGVDLAAARRVLASRGWRRVRRNVWVDVCPECMKRPSRYAA